MLRCKTCQTPVFPGCRGERGADGAFTLVSRPDGTIEMAAVHWRAACSGRRDNRRWSPMVALMGGRVREQHRDDQYLAA